MQVIQAAKALAAQLSALDLLACRGTQSLSVPCEVEDLVGWLNAQRVTPRLYWQPREASAAGYAVLGEARAFDSLVALQVDMQRQAQGQAQAQAQPASGSPDYFGGVAFDAQAAGWPGFSDCRFILPRVLLKRQQGRCTLSVNLRFDDRPPAEELAAAQACLAAIAPEQPLPPVAHGSYQRCDTPTRPEWARWVSQVTQPERLQQLPKVVLSRETCLTAERVPSPWALLGRWQAEARHCFHFGVQWAPGTALIGCSPERLYRRQGQQLITEALAGTTRRGRDTAQDEALAGALLADKKNGLENQCVYQQLLTQLEPLAQRLEMGEAHVVPLRSVQHIRREIHAELHPFITDQQLLSVLPPTPAVGGTPRAAALARIRELERHARGWYAGAFGRVGHGSSELAVSIRCAQVSDTAIRLYAGAGIVAGSQAEDEWHELDAKIADILSLLGMG